MAPEAMLGSRDRRVNGKDIHACTEPVCLPQEAGVKRVNYESVRWLQMGHGLQRKQVDSEDGVRLNGWLWTGEFQGESWKT